jgi:hypothetical protein
MFFLNLTEVFLTLTGVFPCFFLSCKANARVKLAKTGHGLYSSTLVVTCVVGLLFVFYVLFVCKCVLPLGDNPIAVNKYIIQASHRLVRSIGVGDTGLWNTTELVFLFFHCWTNVHHMANGWRPHIHEVC